MIRLTTFGTLSCTTTDGQRLLAGRSRTRLAVLAVIATAGAKGIRRERLGTLFWPDRDDERARNALRQALFALKRDLGGAELTEGVTELRLNTAVVTADVADFVEAMDAGQNERAISNYGGAFLDGVVLRESREFEAWAEEHRQLYARAYARALESTAVAASERTDHAGAVTWWARTAANDPCSGRIARHYMQALASAGDRAGAVRHASIYAAAVRSLLDIEPDPSVLALAESLRVAPPSGDSAVVEPASPRLVSSHVSLSEEPPAVSRIVEPPASTPSGTAPPRRSNWMVLAAIAAAVIAVVQFVRPSRATASERDRARIERVHVTAISNLTGDSTLNGLVDALGQQVRARLATAAGLSVVEQKALSGSPGDVTLRGSVRRVRDSLHLAFEVVSARDGRVVRVLDPVLAPVSAPAMLTADGVQTAVGALAALADSLYLPWSSAQSRTPRYDAYTDFLKGIEALRTQGPVEARTHFAEAMRHDPKFVEAKLWYLEMADGTGVPEMLIDSVRREAVAEREQLGEFDQLKVDRQMAWLDGRLEDVYTATRRLMAIAPGVPDAQFMHAHASMATRRYQEALQTIHGISASPGWLEGWSQIRTFEANAHRLLGQFDEGIDHWRTSVSAAPENYGLCTTGVALMASSRRVLTVDSLIQSCSRLPNAPIRQGAMWHSAGRQLRAVGDTAAARKKFERLRLELVAKRRDDGSKWFDLALVQCELGDFAAARALIPASVDSTRSEQFVLRGLVAGYTGDTATARATLRWAKRRAAGQRRPGDALQRQAFLHIALGEPDLAIEQLRKAQAAGVAPAFNSWYVRWELLPLRNDPAFRELVEPVRP